MTTTFDNRASAPARLAVGAALLAALALAGCQTRTRLQPAPEATATGSVASAGIAASAEMQNVSILVDAGAWDGDPEVETYVSPLRVEIRNDSDRPLRLRYNDFALVEPSNGQRFAALPPYSIEGSVSERATARFSHDITPGFGYTAFHVSPFYRDLYPGLPYWERPFHYDPFYYDHYHEFWIDIPLPTERMLRLVLPEGVIDPGGSVSGFLYFERVDPELERVEFRFELTDADNGMRFGMISIPFLVREE